MTEEPENPAADAEPSRASLIEAISASLGHTDDGSAEGEPLTEAAPEVVADVQPVIDAQPEQEAVEDAPVEVAPFAEAEPMAVELEPVDEPAVAAVAIEPVETEAQPEPDAVDDEQLAQAISDAASADAAAAEGAEADTTIEPGAEVAAEGENSAQEPEAAAVPAAAEVAAIDVGPQPKVALWPFIAYGLVWVAFAGVVVWRLLQIPADVAVFEDPIYQLTVLGGLALACCGPIVALAAWFSAWGTPDSTKGGLFVSALVRGSIFTFCGVTLWWLALIIIDQLRLGRVL